MLTKVHQFCGVCNFSQSYKVSHQNNDSYSLDLSKCGQNTCPKSILDTRGVLYNPRGVDFTYHVKTNMSTKRGII